MLAARAEAPLFGLLILKLHLVDVHDVFVDEERVVRGDFKKSRRSGALEFQALVDVSLRIVLFHGILPVCRTCPDARDDAVELDALLGEGVVRQKAFVGKDLKRLLVDVLAVDEVLPGLLEGLLLFDFGLGRLISGALFL